MIVIADTSPLNYLILIGHVDILQSLFGPVLIPPAVRDELLSPLAPQPVQDWITNPPLWLEVRTPTLTPPSLHAKLGAGEREAISLARASSEPAVLLIDETIGRNEAKRLGLKVAGTLGILLQAHRQKLLILPDALQKLKGTNFKVSDAVMQQFSEIV